MPALVLHMTQPTVVTNLLGASNKVAAVAWQVIRVAVKPALAGCVQSTTTPLLVLMIIAKHFPGHMIQTIFPSQS